MKNKLSFYPCICRWVFLMTFLSIVSSKANAQFYAVKVDVLGLATTTINVEGAIVLHNQWTAHLPLKYNPWTISGKSYKHATAMPGIRYWLIDSYSRGWFFGVNAVFTAYNFKGLIGDRIDYFGRNYRYKGWGCGGGISAGYSLPIAKRWNIEFEGGIAGVWMDHDIYDEEWGGLGAGYQKGFLPVPGKIGVNIVYLF